MARDYQLFPDDENGDILQNMADAGDKLGVAREVDFSVIFPDEDAALQFAVHFLRNEQKVSFGPYEGDDDMPWQVQAHPVMAPSHAIISGYEAQLAGDAERFGGRVDGWGCFSQE